jgi:hypothetical protein
VRWRVHRHAHGRDALRFVHRRVRRRTNLQVRTLRSLSYAQSG